MHVAGQLPVATAMPFISPAPAAGGGASNQVTKLLQAGLVEKDKETSDLKSKLKALQDTQAVQIELAESKIQLSMRKAIDEAYDRGYKQCKTSLQEAKQLFG